MDELMAQTSFNPLNHNINNPLYLIPGAEGANACKEDENVDENEDKKRWKLYNKEIKKNIN